MTVTAIRAPLTAGQREVLAAVFNDAMAWREPQDGNCGDCDRTTGGLCPDHAADYDRCDDYLNLARELGIEAL